MVSLKENSATRSSVSTSIGAVKKKSVLDYLSRGRVATRSASADDVAVYEVALDNSDGTHGFAIVVDENSPTLLAFSQIGSVADTAYNYGLAFWFREMAKALTVETTGNVSATRSFDLFEDEWIGGVNGKYLYYHDDLSTKIFDKNIALVSTPNDTLYIKDWYPTPMVSQGQLIATNAWTQGVPVAWEQGNPYNMLLAARLSDGTPASVGCFGIAAASIICYHRYFPLLLSGTIDWARLQQYRYLTMSYVPQDLIFQGALLCKTIAEDGGATVWSDGTGSTNPEYVERAFDKFGYNIKRYDVAGYNNLDEIDYVYRFIMLAEMGSGRPVLIGASNSNWTYYPGIGHVWVIDGYYWGSKYHYFVERTIKSNKYSYDQYRCESRIFMTHMIWGFGNNSNGWYASFKPSIDPRYDFDANITLFTGISPK